MKSRVLGSILIVAGITIGAGMLAMPLASAGIGFLPTLAMMIGLWALMSYSALMLVEVHLSAPEEPALSALAERYLGKPGRWLISFSMLFLMYALTAAYITGGGSQLVHNVNSWFDWALTPTQGTLLFTVLLGGAVCVSTRFVDSCNRVLFSIKLIALALVLLLLIPHVEAQNLTAMPVQNMLLLSALPVFFTSFGFHICTTSLVRYLEGDAAKLRFVFLTGSAIPLVIYILWQLATHGAISQQAFTHIIDVNPTLSGLMETVDSVVQNPRVDLAVRIFADMALATSFLGVSLALFDFLADACRRSNQASGRMQTGLLTFIPPVLFALFYPQGFILALGYAAIPLAILALLLPAAMVRKARQQAQQKPYAYQVMGGTAGLALVAVLGVFVIAVQIASASGLLPTVAG